MRILKICSRMYRDSTSNLFAAQSLTQKRHNLMVAVPFYPSEKSGCSYSLVNHLDIFEPAEKLKLTGDVSIAGLSMQAVGPVLP